jgi:hypothetical protein
LRLRPAGRNGDARQEGERQRQGQPSGVVRKVDYNENEFQFQYHDNTLTTGGRAPQRFRSLLDVITLTPGTLS